MRQQCALLSRRPMVSWGALRGVWPGQQVEGGSSPFLLCPSEAPSGVLRGDIINAYKYLKSGCQEDGARLFSVVPCNRTRGNGHKLKHRKFQLNMKKHFFTLRVTEHWNRLPRDVVDSPSLERSISAWI